MSIIAHREAFKQMEGKLTAVEKHILCELMNYTYREK